MTELVVLPTILAQEAEWLAEVLPDGSIDMEDIGMSMGMRVFLATVLRAHIAERDNEEQQS